VHTARTPAHGADVPRPTHHQRRQSPPARGPARLDARLPPDEELLACLGDAIDDRIAEIVDEMLEERNSPRRHRPGRYISAVSLILAALAASALLRHNPIAWTIWPSAAVISLATAWTARAGRS
jgi:hypothetical protein